MSDSPDVCVGFWGSGWVMFFDPAVSGLSARMFRGEVGVPVVDALSR